MKSEMVEENRSGKTVKGYRYAPTVILIPNGTVPDSDESMVTDKKGFRYQRKITGASSHAMLFEYHMI